MDTLLTIGVAGATPFVVQFLLDFRNNGQMIEPSRRTKMTLSILTGGILAILIALRQGVFPEAPLEQFFIILDGLINGALATGGVALGFKVAEKIGTGEEILISGTSEQP
jgi:hypothetical protein